MSLMHLAWIGKQVQKLPKHIIKRIDDMAMHLAKESEMPGGAPEIGHKLERILYGRANTPELNNMFSKNFKLGLDSKDFEVADALSKVFKNKPADRRAVIDHIMEENKSLFKEMQYGHYPKETFAVGGLPGLPGKGLR